MNLGPLTKKSVPTPAVMYTVMLTSYVYITSPADVDVFYLDPIAFFFKVQTNINERTHQTN